jgi:hypothetical protein
MIIYLTLDKKKINNNFRALVMFIHTNKKVYFKDLLPRIISKLYITSTLH